jgi:hypothetical protein
MNGKTPDLSWKRVVWWSGIVGMVLELIEALFSDERPSNFEPKEPSIPDQSESIQTKG